MIHTTRDLRQHKVKTGKAPLQMLTCYDYQNARMLDQAGVDMILVGDSLGNVILGHETTVPVTIEEMTIFSSAVKRGAKNTFTIADLPFGSYSLFEDGVRNAISLFQKSKVEAIKLEGARPIHLEIIKRLIETGIPVMGHIGLTPQSVHELGGYYTHGKNESDAKRLLDEARALEKAGVFSIVLECVTKEVSKSITDALNIPTIGIGSGQGVDGQVLVLNDLLRIGPDAPPKFCTPIANLFETKKNLIEEYLTKNRASSDENLLDH
jgi:3-methyl-2-oxobutanoate hydroxymethyltransferase